MTMFPPATNVMFIRSMGEPVLAQVVGHSEHGDAYHRITYARDGKTVLHDRASVRRLSLPRTFTPSRSRSRSPYIGSPLNTSYAEFFRFMLQFLCLQMCVYGGSAVPQGGRGTVTWQPSPRGWWGTVFPGVGQDKGGGGLWGCSGVTVGLHDSA